MTLTSRARRAPGQRLDERAGAEVPDLELVLGAVGPREHLRAAARLNVQRVAADVRAVDRAHRAAAEPGVPHADGVVPARGEQHVRVGRVELYREDTVRVAAWVITQ